MCQPLSLNFLSTQSSTWILHVNVLQWYFSNRSRSGHNSRCVWVFYVMSSNNVFCRAAAFVLVCICYRKTQSVDLSPCDLYRPTHEPMPRNKCINHVDESLNVIIWKTRFWHLLQLNLKHAPCGTDHITQRTNPTPYPKLKLNEFCNSCITQGLETIENHDNFGVSGQVP